MARENLDPVDAIKTRMKSSGRTRKDLENIVGSSSRASEILNRRVQTPSHAADDLEASG